eukprot:PITA_03507
MVSFFQSFGQKSNREEDQNIKDDNGTEYESNEFNNYCREVGIKRETATAYTPEQNGVAKRKSRFIIEATHVSLHDQSLLKFLWVEAANTVVYIQNRCPHQALDSKTPEEVFTMEISHDVTFDEDVSLGKISNLPIPRKDKEANSRKRGEPQDEQMHNVEGPMDPTDPLTHEPSSKRRASWLRETLKDVERHVAPRETFRESRKLNRYQWYLTAMSTIVQSKPCTFEEVVKHQVWKDVINEEYESIIKNDAWDVVPIPKEKSIVTSKWLYKIKHGAYGSVEKFNARFVAQDFSQKEGVDYDEIFAHVARYTTIRLIIALADSQG